MSATAPGYSNIDLVAGDEEAISQAVPLLVEGFSRTTMDEALETKGVRERGAIAVARQR